MRPVARLAVLCALAGPLAGWAADTPRWLLDLAAAPAPATAGDAPAVVLLNDTRLEVDDRGRVTELHRLAVKILNNSGRKHATGIVGYNGASAEVQAANAWVVRAGQTVESKGRSEWLDLATNAPGAAIDEMRVSTIDLSGRAVTGDVMGYETRTRTPLVVAQLYWEFGDRLPQAVERVSLVLPEGFTPSAEMHGDRQPVLEHPSANTWAWSVAGLPYLPDEPAAPDSARTAAELFIRIQGPATGAWQSLRGFGSWSDVSSLYEQLNAGQCDSSPALAAKVRELIASENDPRVRITRLGEYVQRIRYVGINRGLRYGFGWKARKASEIFSTGFGDCKDKANLLMAMLREAGIKSYRVIARLDRERVVRGEFPSPIQFNHAILAIEAPESADWPAVLPVAGLGRLLFFDPTDPYTAVGDLSLDLQGSNVHVSAPGINELTRLPQFAAEAGFRLERRFEMSLAPDGALTLKGTVAGVGQAGARLRGQIAEAGTPQEMEKLATQQLAAGFKSAVLTEAKGNDERAAGRAGLMFACLKKGYLQFNPDGTAVLKLDVLSRQHLPNLTGQKRQRPVALLPIAVHDELDLQLPAGYAVDELPPGAELKSDYGTFSVAYEVQAERLVLKRRLALVRKLVGAEDYGRLRQFLGDISRADRTAVLIRKKS